MVNYLKGPLCVLSAKGALFSIDQYCLLHTKSIIKTLTITKKKLLNWLLSAYFIVHYSEQVQIR
jgi:hypothetical protein